LRFVVFFLVAFGLWFLTAPVVNHVLVFCAEKIVFLFDNYDITKAIDSVGKKIYVLYAPSPDGEPYGLNYRHLTFNTVFLLALIMSVPNVDSKLRLKILIIGMICLFPVQVFRLVVTVFNYYGQHIKRDGESIYPAVYRKGLWYSERILARLDGQLIPVAIWAGLFFYYKWYYRYFKKRMG
jgi:hypothetical protein